MYQPLADATPVPPQDLHNILDIRDTTARQQALYTAGAKNAVPPLPRSSHLRSKKNGIVFPWDATLAEQRDIMDGTLYSLTRKMRRMGFFITQRGHRYRIR